MKTIQRRKMMSKELLMLIDGSNLAYRAYFKFKKLRTVETGRVGLIYGFLMVLHSYLIRFEPSELVITFDTQKSKKSNFRVKLLPEYKGTRKQSLDFDQEDYNHQIKVLQRVLRFMGIRQIIDKKGLNHESDDYLAYLATNSNLKTLIISSDKDFVQLVDSRVKIYHPHKESIIVPKNCEKVMGYSPAQHLQFLILTGDTSDNIAGYRGIGPVKAKKFLSQWASIPEFISDKDASFPGVTKEGMEFLYNKNRVLIDLKYALEKYPIDKIPYARETPNMEKAKNILLSNGMSTLTSPKFINTFKKLSICQE